MGLRRHLFEQGLTSNLLVVAVTVFLVLVGNSAFFSEVLKVYPLSAHNAISLATLPFMLGAATLLLLASVCFGWLSKPLLVVVLLLSSLAAYFMDSFGVIINDEMLQNAAQTNVTEASDLLNLRLLAYFGLLGILPAVVLARIPVR